MPIEFACTCGRALKAADEHAGKRAKCPGCGATPVIPTPEPEPEEAEFEFVEDDPAPAPAKPPAAPAKATVVTTGDAKKPPPGKKKRRRSDEDGALSQMYMRQVRDEQRRDAARARAAGGWGRDEVGGGWTMFGVTVTAGVLTGLGMVFTGLLATAVILLFREEIKVGPKTYFYAIGWTAIGGIILIKALFFGEED